jgi:hypothetical protein
MSKMDKIFDESKQFLESNETVVSWISASYQSKTGVLVATNKRTYFYGKKLFGYNYETIPYAKISSIDVNKQMNRFYVKLFTSGNEISIMSISPNTIEFVQDVKQKIS